MFLQNALNDAFFSAAKLISGGLIGESEVPQQAKTNPLFERAVNCTVKIVKGDYSVGTGTLVDLTKYGLPRYCILTNHHVLPDQYVDAHVYFIFGSINEQNYKWYKYDIKWLGITSPRVGSLPPARRLDFTVVELVVKTVKAGGRGVKAGNPPKLEPLLLKPDSVKPNDPVFIAQFPANIHCPDAHKYIYPLKDVPQDIRDGLDDKLKGVCASYGGLPPRGYHAGWCQSQKWPALAMELNESTTLTIRKTCQSLCTTKESVAMARIIPTIA
jgi:hypothetical protein